MTPESAYTKATQECPHPEHWHAPDDYATEAEVTELVAAMVRALQPELVVETGTYKGDTMVAIADALLRNRHGRLVTIETNARRAKHARELAVGLPVEVIHGDSLAYAPDAPVDFAFLDSSFDARPQEYRRLAQFLSPRAVVMFHDTAPHHPLRDKLRQLDLNLVHLPTPRGVSIGRPRR